MVMRKTVSYRKEFPYKEYGYELIGKEKELPLCRCRPEEAFK